MRQGAEDIAIRRVLAKVLEGLPLLNELLRDAVLGGDSVGLWAGVIWLRADDGALSPVREGRVKAIQFQ